MFALVLTVTALSTLALLVLLAKLGRPPIEPPDDLPAVEATPLAEEAYRDAFRDLDAATPTARRQLRSDLAERIGRDFRRLWAVLQFAIPTSANPQFGVVTARQFLAFRRLRLMLTIRRLLHL